MMHTKSVHFYVYDNRLHYNIGPLESHNLRFCFSDDISLQSFNVRSHDAFAQGIVGENTGYVCKKQKRYQYACPGNIKT